jgi:hypothetical protein
MTAVEALERFALCEEALGRITTERDASASARKELQRLLTLRAIGDRVETKEIERLREVIDKAEADATILEGLVEQKIEAALAWQNAVRVEDSEESDRLTVAMCGATDAMERAATAANAAQEAYNLAVAASSAHEGVAYHRSRLAGDSLIREVRKLAQAHLAEAQEPVMAE